MPLQQFHRELYYQQEDIEMVLTLNEDSIRRLYKHYVAQPNIMWKKPHNCDWMTLEDFQNLCGNHSGMQITKREAQHCFCVSQMTKISDDYIGESYGQLQYVEFLEAICRIAECKFKDSEMESIELKEKVEYVLDDMLAVID